MATAIPPTETPLLVAEPDGLYEVIGTQVVEKPPMGAFECGIATLLVVHIGPFVRANRLGQVACETLFSLRPAVERDRRPDVAFVSAERWPIHRLPPHTAAWAVVPDLAIEVVSPNDPATDLLEKIQEYLRAGVRAVWVVYPVQGEVHQFDADTPDRIRRRRRHETLDGGALLPGLRLDLASLFGAEAEPPAS